MCRRVSGRAGHGFRLLASLTHALRGWRGLARKAARLHGGQSLHAMLARPFGEADMGRWAFRAITIGVICAACNAPSPSPVSIASPSLALTDRPSPTVAAVVASPATGRELPAPSGSLPPTCAADQLVLTAGRMGAAAGTFYVNLSLDRVSGPVCSIQASPMLAIVDGRGKVIVQDPAFGTDRAIVDRTLATELGWSSWWRSSAESSSGASSHLPTWVGRGLDDPARRVRCVLHGCRNPCLPELSIRSQLNQSHRSSSSVIGARFARLP